MPTPSPTPADLSALRRARAALTPAQLAVATLVEIASEVSGPHPNSESVAHYVGFARQALQDALRELGHAPAPPPFSKTDLGRALVDIARAGARR